MTMTRALGKAFFALAAFFALVAVVIYVLLSSVNEQVVKNIIIKQINTLTGQVVQLKGPIDLRFFPTPRAIMQDVSLALKANNTTLQAKSIELNLDPWVFFKERKDPEAQMNLEIDSFSIEKLSIKNNQTKEQYYFEEISGYLTGLNTPKTILKKLKIQSGKSKLGGEFIFEPNKITGKINSAYFNTKDFPLFLFALTPAASKTTGQIDIKINMLQVKALPLHNAKLTAKIKGDRISVSPFTAELAQGQLKGDVIINTAKTGSTSINLKASDLNFGAFLNETIGSKSLRGGNTQMTLNASGTGHSLEQVINTLNGNMFLVMGEATVEDQKLQTSASQIVFQAFDILNPLVEKQKHTLIRCAALRAEFKNGTAYVKDNFGLETREFNVWGTGKVNLQSQAIDFELYNKLKSNMQIEIGQFAKYINVKGTLSDPKLSFNPKGLVQEGISAIAGMLSGGSSKLAEQALKMAEDNRPACEVIINKKN